VFRVPPGSPLFSIAYEGFSFLSSTCLTPEAVADCDSRIERQRAGEYGFCELAALVFEGPRLRVVAHAGTRGGKRAADRQVLYL
jgi:hypothetical protein